MGKTNAVSSKCSTIDFFFSFLSRLINSNRGLFFSFLFFFLSMVSNLRKSALISFTNGMFINFTRGRNSRKRRTKLAGTYVAGATTGRKEKFLGRSLTRIHGTAIISE